MFLWAKIHNSFWGNTMKFFFLRIYHFLVRIIKACKEYSNRKKLFGSKVAKAAFKDSLVPPGKSPQYVATIQEYVDNELKPVIIKYNSIEENQQQNLQTDNEESKIIPIWCCWWQGEESMPELVKMCNTRLKQVIPKDKAKLHIITFDNYKEYVDIPAHIVEKFEKGIVTMTTMSDVLRFCLLEKYGGYWLDATVFFTDEIPKEYFTRDFYCQKMTNRLDLSPREACKCNWCGFSMKGNKGNIVFRYMIDAFSHWWKNYDTIIDYVLIDYMLMSGYRHIPKITSVIDSVENNNEDIFEMYKSLNEAYSDELLQKFTKRNVMHKLTYKIDLKKVTDDGKLTLYGYLLKKVNSGKL